MRKEQSRAIVKHLCDTRLHIQEAQLQTEQCITVISNCIAADTALELYKLNLSEINFNVREAWDSCSWTNCSMAA